MQTFIESGDREVNEFQLRFHDIQGIIDRYDTAQNELELSDDTDRYGVQELFENKYYEVKAKFSELLHSVIGTTQSRNRSLRSSRSGNSNYTPR